MISMDHPLCLNDDNIKKRSETGALVKLSFLRLELHHKLIISICKGETERKQHHLPYTCLMQCIRQHTSHVCIF